MESRLNIGFQLIWEYWFLRYIKPQQTQDAAKDLPHLKNQFILEPLQSRNAPLLQQRLTQLKPRGTIYLVNPQEEVTSIQKYLGEGTAEESYIQLISELHSYYLNTRSIFLVYRREGGGSQCSEGMKEDNISEGQPNRSGLQGLLKGDNRTESNPKWRRDQLSSEGNKVFNSNEQDSLQGRNDSVLDKLQHKIEDLQILDRLEESEGFQIWNCKYKHIPHSFIKVTRPSWIKCLTLPIKHPSQPRTLHGLPILPRISKLKPSIDKLLPFVSYLKLLDRQFPHHLPTTESIFEYNNLPIVLSHEDTTSGWGQEGVVGLLCYYVVYGDEGGRLTARKVERWAEDNSETLLGKTIRQLNKREKEKLKIKKDLDSKALVLFDGDPENANIW